MVTRTGQAAEAAVADYLADRGFRIIDKNWKTKVCEIDIIAEKDKVIYFTEVKYRQSADHGSGLEYITDKKLNQIRFSARVWARDHNYDGDYRVLGVEVAGNDFNQIDLVEIA